MAIEGDGFEVESAGVAEVPVGGEQVGVELVGGGDPVQAGDGQWVLGVEFLGEREGQVHALGGARAVGGDQEASGADERGDVVWPSLALKLPAIRMAYRLIPKGRP